MRSFFIIFVSVLLFTVSSCKSKKSDNPVAPASAEKRLSEKFFGTMGTDTIIEYTLTNTGRMQVSIINYGGTAVSYTHLTYDC